MSNSKQEVLKITSEKISEVTGFSREQIAIIKANVAKGTSDNELALFCQVSKNVGLDPLAKEIWCYKDHKQNLIIFASRDGFLRKAQENPMFNGIRSMEVCQNDDVFIMDIPNGKIEHRFDARKDRGAIVGAYAIVFRKDGEPTIEWAENAVYNKHMFTWNTHEAEMNKKVAEVHALKKAMGISGVQSEHDFEVNQETNTVTPIDTSSKNKELETIDVLKKEILFLCRGNEEGQKVFKECQQKQESGEFTISYAEGVIRKLTESNE